MSEENANVLTNIIPKILARGLMVLRSRCVMPRLVNSDYSLDAAKKGSTIDIPVPVAVSTIDVDPNRLPVAKAVTTPGLVQVSLNNWKQNAPIGLSDKDLCLIDATEHFLPMQLMEAVKALATDVNVEIFSHYCGASRGVYGVAGTLSDGFGQTPFDSSNQGVAGATLARKVLNEQLCPKSDRRGVIDWAAEANMLSLSEFSDAEKIMSAVVKMEGEIGRKYAIDWVADDDVPTHTPGTLVAGDTITGSGTAGESVLTVIAQTGNTHTLKNGDILTVAGDTQTYVVIGRTASAEYSSGTYTFASDPDTVIVGIQPALVTSPSGATVTPYAEHVVNMAFHRDAFAFATRPLLDVSRQYSLGSQMLSMQDPVTGLILRLEVSRQHKQTVWEFDILWGSDLVRSELATRIVGKGS